MDAPSVMKEAPSIALVEVPASELIRLCDEAHRLSARLAGLEGILDILSERFNKHTSESRVLSVASELAGECLFRASDMQGGPYYERAMKALGLEG